MKKPFLFTVFLLTYLWSFSSHKINVSSKIKNVTVSLDGAQVFRSGNVQLKKGINYLTFNDVSAKLNPNSVQANGNGNFVILDVKHNIVYPEPVPEKVIPKKFQQEINRLQDSILMSRFEIERIKENKQDLINEKNLLKSNKIMTSSDTITELKESLKFYRYRLGEIEDLIFSIKIKEHKLEARRVKMDQRLAVLKNYRTNTSPVNT